MELRECAITLLARREHSQLELERRLVSKGFAADEVASLLAALAEEGLQNDERYTEIYVRQRIEAGFGYQRISLELQQRGIGEALIDQYLSKDDDFWWQQLASLWQRKYHNSQIHDDRDYTKRARFLVQRGFSTEQVYQWLADKRAVHAETYE